MILNKDLGDELHVIRSLVSVGWASVPGSWPNGPVNTAGLIISLVIKADLNLGAITVE